MGGFELGSKGIEWVKLQKGGRELGYENTLLNSMRSCCINCEVGILPKKIENMLLCLFYEEHLAVSIFSHLLED